MTEKSPASSIHSTSEPAMSSFDAAGSDVGPAAAAAVSSVQPADSSAADAGATSGPPADEASPPAAAAGGGGGGGDGASSSVVELPSSSSVATVDETSGDVDKLKLSTLMEHTVVSCQTPRYIRAVPILSLYHSDVE